MFLLDVTCGNTGLVMNEMIPKLVSTAVNLIKIAVPVLLIIYGMMDLGKAVMAQKDDEIKKGQQTFIKRLTAAVVVFLVLFIVQIVIGLVSNDESGDIWDCVNCFINNDCKSV